MQAFDIIAAAIGILFIILGIKRGFVEEIIRLVGIIAAFFIGLSLYRQLLGYLSFIKISGSFLSVISFILIFLVSLLIIMLLGKLLRKIIHLTVLGWFDRLCGSVLGLVKAFFLVWIIVITIASLPLESVKHWFVPSKTYSFFAAISPTLKISGLVPNAGPVQNILKANPVPAIVNAYKSISSSSKKTAPPSGVQTGNQQAEQKKRK
jgi:membrane protein required for colicin V production